MKNKNLLLSLLFGLLLFVVLLELPLVGPNTTEVLLQYVNADSLSPMFSHFFTLKTNENNDLFRELPFNLSNQEDNNSVEDNNSNNSNNFIENNNEYDNNNNDGYNNLRAFSELPGSDIYSDDDDDDDNRIAFSELPGYDIFSGDDNNNSIEDDNSIEENNNIDSSDAYTNTTSSNDRSSNNDPFYYDRVLANRNYDVISEVPSYHTYPNQPAPSYKTYGSTAILYNSELGEGETFIGNSALGYVENDSISDNDSVYTQDIEERHMLTIRGGKATRRNSELRDDYGNDLNGDRFSQEMMECIKNISTDCNRSIQRIGTDLIHNRITRSYAKKAIELVHLDSEDLNGEVYETEHTLKEVL